MIDRLFSGATGLAVLLVSGLLSASEPTAELIQQLGSADFEKRVAAERQLLHQGPSSLEMIGQGLQSEDPEIRERSRRLLDVLQKVAFTQQRERVREDPWTADPELTPAWEVYQSLVGDSWEARDLYVRMIDEETELMMAVSLRPELWPLDYDRRCADLRTFVERRSNRDLDPAAIACLLFLAVHPDNKLSPLSASTIATLISDLEFFNAVEHAEDRESKVYRALLSHWVRMTGHSTAPTRLQLATKFHLSAGLSAAHEIIANRNAVGQSRTQLQNAVRFMASHGGPDVLPDLEQLLDLDSLRNQWGPEKIDASAIQHPPSSTNRADVLINDMALLAMIQITQQDPQSYGFVNSRLDDYRYGTNAPTFSSEEERQQALLKWQRWRATHQLDFQPRVWDASEGISL